MSRGLGMSYALVPFVMAAIASVGRSSRVVIPVPCRKGPGFAYTSVPCPSEKPAIPNVHRGHDPHTYRGKVTKGHCPNSI